MDQLRLCDPGDKDGEVKVAEYERPAMSESNLVPEVGIEPTLPEGNGILSPARLPVSPLRHRMVTISISTRFARFRLNPRRGIRPTRPRRSLLLRSGVPRCGNLAASACRLHD